MSFDVKSANFNPIKYPEGISKFLHPIPYEGRLALVTMLFPFDSANLYILKRWTQLDT